MSRSDAALTLPPPSVDAVSPRTLAVARGAWLAVTAAVLLLAITAFPIRYDRVQARDPGLRVPEISRLIEVGMPPSVAARLDAVVSGVFFVTLFVGGVVLFARGGSSREALFLAFMLVTCSASYGGLTTVHRTIGPPLSQPLAGIVATMIACLQSATIWIAMFWLPQGHFVWRWTAVAAAFGITAAVGAYWLVPFPRSHDLVNLIGLPFTPAAAFAQIAQYRLVRDATRRQQIKWVVFGLMVPITAFFAGQTLVLVIGDRVSVAARATAAIAELLILAANLVFVVCLAIAIRRYRLWRVDLVINRSLVYGAVTFALMLIFLGGGFLLQRIVGQDNAPIAFGVSVAAAALAFAPARQRAQQLVDYHVYGLRVDLGELSRARRRPAVRNAGMLTGRRLGRYQVHGVLGRGGMGEVYQAEGDGRSVAIKILPADLVGQSGFLKWFDREAETLAALSHPNIVRFREAGESDGLHYLVLEFIDGRDLSALLGARRRLTVADVRPLMESVTAALDYAHERGYVHRDIKPSNIMVRSDTGTAVLTDFGVSKFRDGRTALTSTGAVGTIQYMSPEQILAAKTVDARADIYALGVMLYELLTGELPFTGNAGELIFAHLQQRPPDPRARVPELPSSVAAGILRAMEKRPEDRFQSAGELMRCLH